MCTGFNSKLCDRETGVPVIFFTPTSPDIISIMKSRRESWTRHVARMGRIRNKYGVLVGKPEGKRSFGRLGRRWKGNIKVDLKEIGYGVWTGFNWLRRTLVNTVMSIRVSQMRLNY
jgi:hypothetical protein